MSLALQGNIDEAIVAYNEALQYREDFKEVYNNLGAVYIDRGRIDDAIASYKRAIEISPNFAEAYNNLGVAYTKTRLTMMRSRHSKRHCT